MLAWITDNFSTILIAVLFFAVVAWAVLVLRKDRKKGGCSSCGSCGGCGGCSGCGMQSSQKK